MPTVRIGDLFKLESDGIVAYLQYAAEDERIAQLVRVLTPYERGLIGDPADLVGQNEQFLLYFPLKKALREKIVQKIGSFALPDSFQTPAFMRTKHMIGSELKGWHIVNVETWERVLVAQLTEEQKKLSPWGIWNDTLLIERLKAGWNLENW
jgi:hypothetical protein